MFLICQRTLSNSVHSFFTNLIRRISLHQINSHLLSHCFAPRWSKATPPCLTPSIRSRTVSGLYWLGSALKEKWRSCLTDLRKARNRDFEKTRETEQEGGGGLERERERENEKEKGKEREPGGGGVRERRSTAWLTNRGSLQSQADEKERRRKGEGWEKRRGVWCGQSTPPPSNSLPSLPPPPSRKSMPALLVFLPSLVKALRRGEQTSGLLVRPWPAVCDASWEFFSLLPF